MYTQWWLYIPDSQKQKEKKFVPDLQKTKY